MNTSFLTGQLVLDTLKTSVTQFVVAPSDVDPDMGDRIVPLDLRQRLARLRLLESVPFAYLVPDSLLLPPESIRFFYVDRNWTDALVEGALSVGTVNSSDRAQLEQLYPQIRDEIDEDGRCANPAVKKYKKDPREQSADSCFAPAPSPAGPACTCALIAKRLVKTTRSFPNPVPTGSRFSAWSGLPPL